MKDLKKPVFLSATRRSYIHSAPLQRFSCEREGHNDATANVFGGFNYVRLLLGPHSIAQWHINRMLIERGERRASAVNAPVAVLVASERERIL